MNYYQQLGQRAKQSLKGYWLRSMVALGVWLASVAAVSMLFQLGSALTYDEQKPITAYIWSLASILAIDFVDAPLCYGFRLFLWRRALGEQPSSRTVLELFGSAKRLFGAVFLEVVRFVITFVPAALLIAPKYVFKSFNLFAGMLLEGVWTATLDLIALAGIAYAAYMYFRLFAADHIYIAHNSMGVVRSVLISLSATKGRVRHIIAMYVRFIPWLLLNITGFAQLYVTPYFEMAKCHFIADLIKYSAEDSNEFGFDRNAGVR